MRVRTIEELVDFLADRSQLRRRELITLKQLINTKRLHEENIVCRSSVVLSYANWEGFIKDAATAYVEYVSYKSPAFNELSPNFKAIVCRSMFIEAAKAKKRIFPHLRVVEQFSLRLSEKADLKSGSAIDTESNLNSDVFENICTTVGIDYSNRWSTYGPFIDDMFKYRCSIAHGELMTPSSSYVIEVIDFVQQAISWFRTDIENAVLELNYLKC